MARSRTLGVLGGMGPAATAEFLRLLAVRVAAGSDQEHPRILMLSEPGIPDRTAALLRGDDAPLLPIRQALFTLADWGAELLAVPCNTAHVYIDRFRSRLPVPLVHIVEASVRAAEVASPDGAWLTATAGTVAGGIYQRYAQHRGYRLLLPHEALQQRIHAATVLVKANRLPAAGATLGSAVHELLRIRCLPVISACTELPLAYAHSGLPAEFQVSSVDALASACAHALYPHRGPVPGLLSSTARRAVAGSGSGSTSDPPEGAR
ncbi:aspartate/glutamate racemase family protein [Embleya scabrispora]|uniref:aspartate/glutamate racemase family protein n=1 Tax=Embleya scabrispora TaxID=159449 RepID=UPI00039D6B3B|nr:amino acid racemase [Embleya scabrispora]